VKYSLSNEELKRISQITIQKSKTADSRQADHVITKEELEASTQQHISDVQQGILYICGKLMAASKFHDHTKLEFMDQFYEQFHKAQETGTWDESDDGWFKKYHLLERHHLTDRAPEDVNLIDVMEMMVDCVMAGMARTGTYKEGGEPSPELLLKAYRNTAKQLVDNIKVQE